jgi:hypothetical protein
MEALMSEQMYVVPAAASVIIGQTQMFTAENSSGTLTYTSSNPAIASIDSNGELTAVTEGETTITVTDAAGQTATSLPVFVITEQAGGGACPLGNEQLCQLMCMILPQLPFCQ